MTADGLSSIIANARFNPDNQQAQNTGLETVKMVSLYPFPPSPGFEAHPVRRPHANDMRVGRYPRSALDGEARGHCGREIEWDESRREMWLICLRVCWRGIMIGGRDTAELHGLETL